MNNNLLVEVFDRLIALEKRVEELEKRTDSPNVELSEKIAFPKTRKEALENTIKTINELNPSLNAYKGTRKEGGGIIFRGSNLEMKRIKFYYSKSYDLNNLSAWHTINDYHITDEQSDYYVLCVNYNERLYSFLYKYDELNVLLENKKMDQSKQYHFYIQQENDEFYDNRDVDSTIAKNCVTEYLDSWSKLT